MLMVLVACIEDDILITENVVVKSLLNVQKTLLFYRKRIFEEETE